MTNRSWLPLLLIVLHPLMIASCTSSSPVTVSSDAIAQNRPGLATRWGETRNSQVNEVQFTRAHPSVPTATTRLYYNDQQGATAISHVPSYQRIPAELFPVGDGLVSLGIRDESGQLLEGFLVNGDRYIIGETGRRYAIVVHNNTSHRLEAVLSVDGLDVLDGKPASVAKSGYVISPYATLEVDGFRQSLNAVAAFRFGSVAESYAHRKYGETRNVGVMGLAIFHEYGDHPPFWTNDEIQQRRSANPFPRDFATPP